MFFGFETDTALALYLFAVIDRAVSTETAGFRRANPHFRGVRLRQASASFQHGVVARVADRLDARHHAVLEAGGGLPQAHAAKCGLARRKPAVSVLTARSITANK